jgi:hypothetical protein
MNARQAPQQQSPAPKRTTAKTTATKTARTGSPRPRAGSEDKPRYQQQLPVGARLWAEQVNDLTPLRRRISSERTDKSERITDNTLIRVGVDLVLALGDQLHGDTEDELRASALAALKAPKSRRA